MTKSLIVLSIISLLALSGIFLFNGKRYTQESPVTFGEYNFCVYQFENLLKRCENDNDFKQARRQFLFKTYQSTGITPECKQHQVYQRRSGEKNILNLNNTYSNCYQDPQIVAIANTSSCFLANYYNVIIQCAGV